MTAYFALHNTNVWTRPINGIAWRGTGTFSPGTRRTYKSGEGWRCFDDYNRKINATMLPWKTSAGKLESDLKTDAYRKPTVAEICEAVESPAKADCK